MWILAISGWNPPKFRCPLPQVNPLNQCNPDAHYIVEIKTLFNVAHADPRMVGNRHDVSMYISHPRAH